MTSDGGDFQTSDGDVTTDATPPSQATDSQGAHTHTVSGTSGSTGSSGAHNNAQPTFVLNKIIFAGV